MKKKIVVLSGDHGQFTQAYEKLESEYVIHEKFINTQFAQVMNPTAQLKGIKTGQPDMVNVVICTGMFFVTKKEKAN